VAVAHRFNKAATYRRLKLVCMYVCIYLFIYLVFIGCVTPIERRSVAGQLSLSCTRSVADGWPLTRVSRLSYIAQANSPTQPFIPSGVDR